MTMHQGPRAVAPDVIRWLRNAVGLWLRAPWALVVVVVASALSYWVLRRQTVLLGVLATPVAIFVCAELAAKADGRAEVRWRRSLSSGAMCALPWGLFFGAGAVYAHFTGQTVSVAAKRFDGLRVSWRMFRFSSRVHTALCGRICR